MGSFGDKLREALDRPEPNATSFDGIVLPQTPPQPPPIFTGTVIQAYERYMSECHGTDCEDPRDICVSLSNANFPKLLSLWVKADGNQPARKARAKYVIPQLEKGEFDPTRHTWNGKRLMTLYWIRDVITDPDGIYPNSAQQVEGDEVYVKRYGNMAGRFGTEDVKLVFVEINNAGERVVITSYLEKPQRVKNYCGTPPIYIREGFVV